MSEESKNPSQAELGRRDFVALGVAAAAATATVSGAALEVVETDVNIKTPDGTTALMLARQAGSAGGDELASELVALGALEET